MQPQNPSQHRAMGSHDPSVSDAQGGWSLDLAWVRKLWLRELSKVTEPESGEMRGGGDSREPKLPPP